MRSACALPIVGLFFGCTPATQSEVPNPAVSDVGTPAEDADVSETPVVAAGPGALTTESGEPPPEDEGGEPPASEGEPSSTLAPKSDPDPDPAPTRELTATASNALELPKPLHAKRNDTCGNDPGVGQPLKSFSLPSPSGKTISKSTYRGRVLLVNFWGTWCKPCLEELPEFDQLYRRYRRYGMTLLAIATDEDAEAVTEIVAKRKLAAKVAIAGEDYAGKYGSPKFPFTFIVDHKGIIRASYRGYRPECMGELEADIRAQLEVRAEAKAKRKRKG